MEALADKINRHLASGVVVQVTTYTRSTLYSSKHAGWFSTVKGNLYVRRGKTRDCLSIGDRVLVGIRFLRRAYARMEGP